MSLLFSGLAKGVVVKEERKGILRWHLDNKGVKEEKKERQCSKQKECRVAEASSHGFICTLLFMPIWSREGEFGWEGWWSSAWSLSKQKLDVFSWLLWFSIMYGSGSQELKWISWITNVLRLLLYDFNWSKGYSMPWKKYRNQYINVNLGNCSMHIQNYKVMGLNSWFIYN